MKSLKVIVMSVVMLTICFSLFAKPTYVFVRIENLTEQIIGEKLLKEVYKQLDIDIEVVALPGLRALQEASSGLKDGETLRVYSVGENYPSLLRVPTPLSSLETTAFAKTTKNIVINNEEDLKKHEIAIVRGVVHTTEITENISSKHFLDNTETMFRFLNAGRADIALANRIDGIATLKKLGINDITVSGKVLKNHPLYHYIHEKNKDLVPVVDKKILEMTKSGELNRLRERFEKEFIDSL